MTFFKSLKFKLLLPILSANLIFLIGLYLFINTTSKENIMLETTKKYISIAEHSALKVDNFMEVNAAKAEGFLKMPELIRWLERRKSRKVPAELDPFYFKVVEYFKKFPLINDEIRSIFVADASTGEYFDQDGVTQEIKNPETNVMEPYYAYKRPWFITTKERGKPTYVGSVDQKVHMYYTSKNIPIYNDDKELVGIGGVDLDPRKALAEFIIKLKPSDNGFAFMIDKKGLLNVETKVNREVELEKGSSVNLITLKEQLLTGLGKVSDLKEIDEEIFNQIIEEKTGYTTLNYEGNKFFIYYSQVPSSEHIVILFIPAENVLGNVEQLGRIQLFATLIVIIILFVIMTIASNTLVKRISRVAKILEDVAQGEGDLTKRIRIDSNDEVGHLSKWFNTFLSKLHDIIFRVKVNAEKVSQTVNILSTSVSQSIAAVNEMSAGVQEIDRHAQKQNESTAHTSTSISEMIQNINSIANNIDSQASAVEASSGSIERMAKDIKEIANISTNATKISRELSRVAKEGGQDIKNAIEAIKEVANYSNEINEMVTVISGIAEQTNLLAMNAAIEAAHAGEHGKGFAVVADEIRKLAEDSAKNAKEITDIIKTSIDQTTHTVDLSEKASHGLDRILKDVEQISSTVNDITRSMENQSNDVNGILTNVKSLVNITAEIKSSIKEQNAGGAEISEKIVHLQETTEHISNATKEEAIGSKEIITTMSSLQKVAEENRMVVEELQQLIKMFRLKEEDDENIDEKGITDISGDNI